MRQILLITALLLLFGSQALASKEYTVGAPPDWVVPLQPDVDFEVPTDQTSDGVYYLLSDRQIRAEGHTTHSYSHYAATAFNVTGIESIANVDIAFNPAYQTLTLHSIRVIRNGTAIEKLHNAEVRILQREPDLERLIYDGRKTAHVFLDDVRQGDIVEYAYSLNGRNPVFGDRHFGMLRLNWAVPVRHVYGRLLLPAGPDLTVVTRNTELKPTVHQRGGQQEYVWEQREVAPVKVEKDAPAWYQPHAQVQWSAYPDWPAVARWAAPLYAVPAVSGRIRQVIDSIATSSSDDEARLLAALRFVQSEIRYLGVEVGVGSHRPSHPDVVLERRFGDCKDKTLLLLTLLDGLGIEAHAALVDTEGTRILREQLPTPGAFDHVLVRARLNGIDYWLDPTFNPQGGTLAALHQPNHAYALVVDPKAGDLVAMASPNRPLPRVSIHSMIDSRAGFDAPASYTVTTTAENGAADRQRQILASKSHLELQNNYLNFYANRYPEIRVAAALEVSDDEQQNRLALTERYEIDTLWRPSENSGRITANISAVDLRDRLPSAGSTKRTAPLAVPYPLNISQVTEVLLPEPWPIEPGSTTIEDSVFTFTREIANSGSRLVFTDTFITHTDHVAATEVSRYQANLQRVHDELDYSLWFTDTLPKAWFERFNWMVGLIAVLLLVTWAELARRLYRWDPRPGPAEINPALQGIRGWLLLPALGIIATPLSVLFTLSGTLSAYEIEQWMWLTSHGSGGYHPLWAPTLLFSLAANLALLVFSLLLVVLFFQKRRSVPTIYVSFLAVSLIISGTDTWLASQVPAGDVQAQDIRQLFRQTIALAIWGSYFMASKRVRSTFIRSSEPRQKRAPQVTALEEAIT